MNSIYQITNKCFPHKLNVLACPVHERAQGMLGDVDATFWLIHVPNGKTWNNTYGQLPKNHILIPPEKGQNIPSYVDIDVILSGNRFDNYRFLKPLSDKYKIPLIQFEHTGPYPQWPKEYLQQLNSQRGDVNCFITHWSREAWGWDENECEVIHHGIRSDIFKPIEVEKKQYILSVVNQFSRPERHLPCGYPLWKEVTEGLPTKHLGGDDPGFSEPAKSIEDLVFHYNECALFINTSQISPIPNALLEAASCGAGIVTTATCDIPRTFKHGENCLMSNNPKILREYCKELLNNPDLAKELGKKARQMILNDFSMDKLTDNWNKLLIKTSKLRK